MAAKPEKSRKRSAEKDPDDGGQASKSKHYKRDFMPSHSDGTQPSIEPGAEISKADKVLRYIRKRSLQGGLPFQPKKNTSLSEVKFADRVIQVTLTDDGLVAEKWIKQQNGETIFGFDLEWRPNFIKGKGENRTALLQLSTETACLIFQLLFTNFIPEALIRVLRDPEVKLMGVGSVNDGAKLERDHGLECRGQVEISQLAAERLEREDLKHAGLKRLASEVLGLDLLKPKKITTSNWEMRRLRPAQIQYACIDAYVSFAIGSDLGPCSLNSLIGQPNFTSTNLLVLIAFAFLSALVSTCLSTINDN